jgi:hypothetical protein
MKAGAGLVVTSNRAIGPGVGPDGDDDGADEEELQAPGRAERASNSGKRGKRMATV